MSSKQKNKKGKWGKRWGKAQRWVKKNINPDIYKGNSDNDFVFGGGFSTDTDVSIDTPEYDIDIRMPGDDIFGRPKRKHIKRKR